MTRRTPSFEEVVLGGGCVDMQACEEYAVHGVEAEASWALVMQDCGHSSFMCSACKRDVELRAAAVPGEGRFGMRHAEPCGVPNYGWRWERL